ncbi:tyrosine-type recombinase/integrase [Marinobacter salarius]|jgi:integrase|uniref:tyrosine-type recombinase/integrase n=1 Tax=Marinobacter salarius TaxID=1420917 RepID=UPI0032EB43C7|tara:strand:+ start:676 stop:1644 length:969 start_codon:yes stop_codon:yes gene_type:complete
MNLISAAELDKDIAHFVAFKRAMGHPYQRGELTLKSFQRAVEQRAASHAKVPFEAVLHEWLLRNPQRQPVSVGLEFGVIRQLCLYRRRRDPDSFVPEQNWAPIKESTFLPYIFTYEEVVHLIAAASVHKAGKLDAGMLRMLLLILYCTGLRLGEAVRLQLSDVDPEQQCFLVRQSKGKTRIVPFLDDLARELSDCLLLRRRILEATAAVDPGTLLLRNTGQALPVTAASDAICRLLRREGLKPAKGRTGPRPYEFRHAFAVHRLTAWYHEGVDIHARLPWLSAYMGHVDVLGTQVYLRATPELMDLASQRFARHWYHSGKTS